MLGQRRLAARFARTSHDMYSKKLAPRARGSTRARG
jgi:hypothetical protein